MQELLDHCNELLAADKQAGRLKSIELKERLIKLLEQLIVNGAKEPDDLRN